MLQLNQMKGIQLVKKNYKQAMHPIKQSISIIFYLIKSPETNTIEDEVVEEDRNPIITLQGLHVTN